MWDGKQVVHEMEGRIARVRDIRGGEAQYAYAGGRELRTSDKR